MTVGFSWELGSLENLLVEPRSSLTLIHIMIVRTRITKTAETPSQLNLGGVFSVFRGNLPAIFMVLAIGCLDSTLVGQVANEQEGEQPQTPAESVISLDKPVAKAAWGSSLFGPRRSLSDGPIVPFTKTAGVIYKKTDDYELKCDVFVPEGKGPFPAVLALHGGGWHSGSKLMLSRHAWLMARSGYIVVAANYRQAPEYRFPAQIEDCVDAVRWMRTEGKSFGIDPDRIGGYGYSAGGHLVALLATTSELGKFDRPDDPRNDIDSSLSAVVAGGAPCEFSWVGDSSYLLKYWLGGTRNEVPKQYFDASPANFVTVDDPPFYFYHGQYDLLVPQSSARTLHKKLSRMGIESSFDVVPNSEHIIPFSRLDFMQRGIRFFDRHLK